jgi:hypothetical protein
MAIFTGMTVAGKGQGISASGRISRSATITLPFVSGLKNTISDRKC